ncbi:N-acetylmuramoyl-L-alanine amidase [Nonomuraea ferruginea]
MPAVAGVPVDARRVRQDRRAGLRQPRPHEPPPRRIDYIVIHDTEGPFRGIPRLIRDPEYVSWHYTIRSRDGQIAQHVKTRDIAWHA